MIKKRIGPCLTSADWAVGGDVSGAMCETFGAVMGHSVPVLGTVIGALSAPN